LGQNRENEQMEALGAFIDQGTIDDVLGVVKSGKEATVYACRAPDGGLIAAKVYRSRNVRNFSNASAYQVGRLRNMARRQQRAILSGSRAGREMAFGKWVRDEFDTLTDRKSVV
jgi:RIO kinase 1